MVTFLVEQYDAASPALEASCWSLSSFTRAKKKQKQASMQGVWNVLIIDFA